MPRLRTFSRNGHVRSKRKPACAACIAVMALGGLAWAHGIPLTESKEELGLNYEFSATAKDGTVIVSLPSMTLASSSPFRTYSS